MKNERTLGINIRTEVKKTKKEIEKNLIKISGLEEWFVDINYTCSISVSKNIVDRITVTACPYTGDKKQGEYKFSFNSLEAIFLADICEVMYKIIKNPDDAEKILFNATISIEYLS